MQTLTTGQTLNNHISNMRKKLKVSPDVSNYIKSVIGIGYKIRCRKTCGGFFVNN